MAINFPELILPRSRNLKVNEINEVNKYCMNEKNPEQGWGDSYQKRDRLHEEFKILFKEISRLIKVWATDSDSLESQFGKEIEPLLAEEDSLYAQEEGLALKIQELEKKRHEI